MWLYQKKKNHFIDVLGYLDILSQKKKTLKYYEH